MFIDTHCHPYLSKKKNLDDILSNFERSEGKYLVSIGTDLETSKESIDLSNKYEFIYSTVGIHPVDALTLNNTLKHNIDVIEKYIKDNSNKVVGIGETGLDFHWTSDDQEELKKQKKIQEEYFIEHIKLGKKYNLPLIIHNRNSGDDILRVLHENNCTNFIIHCFSEDLNFAKKCLEISDSAMMSFSGIVTFKNAESIQDTAKNIPLKNILIETDSPFLTPVPHRGKEENEPSYTQYVLEKIQELRSEKPEFIEQEIYKNSLKIFKIKD